MSLARVDKHAHASRNEKRLQIQSIVTEKISPSKNKPGQTIDRLAYTTQETAELLGISAVTVYRLLKRGKLRASTVLRHKLIPRTEIEAFLKSTLDSQRN